MVKKVLKFSSFWCAPCRAIAPMIAQVKKELEGFVDITEYDVDIDTQVASKYSVSAVPTFIFFNDDKEVGRHSGALTKTALLKKINSL